MPLPRHLLLLALLALLALLVLPAPGCWSGEILLSLSSDNEIPIAHYPAGGDRILMLPSEYGFRGEREQALAEGLAEVGFDTWVADLHSAYFLAPGRGSLGQVPIDDMAELIAKAQAGAGRLFILSSGRGAALVLMAVRRWQQRYPGRHPLGGLMLFHPNLLAAAPVPGETPRYLPVARLTNQPILLVQPADSSKRWYTDELLRTLGSGGARVFTRIIPGVSDGFLGRPSASEQERRQSARVPALLAASRRLLSSMHPVPLAPVHAGDEPPLEEWSAEAFGGRLLPYRGESRPPALELDSIGGPPVRLGALSGQVILLNFWATWCPPCVEEIPSLGRLQARFAQRPFQVLSVDVGESREAVEAFLRRVPARFPVLLDPQGSTVKAWDIRAFPTTFLLDARGRIRYAYFGGLEWDRPEVVATVEALLREGG